MAQNNPALYDALIAGGCGGSLERWITSAQSSSYESLVDAVEAFATAVDAAIPTIVRDDGPSLSEINLIQSIAQGTVADRALVSADSDTFADIAAAIAAVFSEAAGRLNNVPPLGGGGGDFPPEGNIVWLDPHLSPETPNGSIASPWTNFDTVWPEMLGSSEVGAWRVMLPGYTVTMSTDDGPIPNLNNNVNLVLEGVSPESSVIDSFFSFNQNGPNKFTFRNLQIPAFNLGGGSNDYLLENVIIGGSSVGGTLQGTIKLINCAVQDLSLGTSGPQVEMYGGSCAGSFSAENAKFFNVTFAAASSLSGDGSGTFQFVGCDFATGTSISNIGTCEFDPYSYATFNAAGAGNTYSGTKRFRPAVLVLGRARITGGGNSINLNSQNTFDFGDPVGTDKVEPGTNITASWGTAANNGLQLRNVSADPGTGHVMAVIGNSTGGTLFLPNPCDLIITYTPRETA